MHVIAWLVESGRMRDVVGERERDSATGTCRYWHTVTHAARPRRRRESSHNDDGCVTAAEFARKRPLIIKLDPNVGTPYSFANRDPLPSGSERRHACECSSRWGQRAPLWAATRGGAWERSAAEPTRNQPLSGPDIGLLQTDDYMTLWESWFGMDWDNCGEWKTFLREGKVHSGRPKRKRNHYTKYWSGMIKGKKVKVVYNC